MRVFASTGAGGVIYLTPLVFNQINLNATQIGIGLSLAAFIGTITRLTSGYLLDKGTNYIHPIRWTALITIFADLILFKANNFETYIRGQLMIGMATGFYWPAIELAVPISCKDFPSIKGFSLARFADACGISIGTLIGTIGAWMGAIKCIYILDLVCMTIVLLLSMSKNLIYQNVKESESENKEESSTLNNEFWLNKLMPILLISLVVTSIISLLQSALPLDLVNGGLVREGLSEGWSGIIIALQLFLLVLLQWPIGSWASNKSSFLALRISLISLFTGCCLLSISSFIKMGYILIILSQLPLTIGIATFLPVTTAIIIRESPRKYKGLSMAIFSQCFAISAIIAPLIGGKLLDHYNNGIALWAGMAIACITMLKVSSTYFRNQKYI